MSSRPSHLVDDLVQLCSLLSDDQRAGSAKSEGLACRRSSGTSIAIARILHNAERPRASDRGNGDSLNPPRKPLPPPLPPGLSGGLLIGLEPLAPGDAPEGEVDKREGGGGSEMDMLVVWCSRVELTAGRGAVMAEGACRGGEARKVAGREGSWRRGDELGLEIRASRESAGRC